MKEYNSILNELRSTNSSVCFDYKDFNQAKTILINLLQNTTFSLYVLLNDFDDELFNDKEVLTNLKKLLENKFFTIKFFLKRDFKTNSELKFLINNYNLKYHLKNIDSDVTFVVSDVNKIQLKSNNKYFTTFNNRQLGQKLQLFS